MNSKELTFIDLLQNGSEKEALDFLENNSKEIYINYSTDHFIFYAIGNRMTSVVKKIVNDKDFQSYKNSFGENAIGDAMYLFYLDASNLELKNKPFAREIVEFLIDSDKIDINEIDDNYDTVLMIACTTPDLNWAVEKLIEKKGVNVNQANDINFTCVGNAVRNKNFEAAKMIMKKFPDIVLTEDDHKVIRETGFDQINIY